MEDKDIPTLFNELDVVPVSPIPSQPNNNPTSDPKYSAESQPVQPLTRSIISETDLLAEEVRMSIVSKDHAIIDHASQVFGVCNSSQSDPPDSYIQTDSYRLPQPPLPNPNRLPTEGSDLQMDNIPPVKVHQVQEEVALHARPNNSNLDCDNTAANGMISPNQRHPVTYPTPTQQPEEVVLHQVMEKPPLTNVHDEKSFPKLGSNNTPPEQMNNSRQDKMPIKQLGEEDTSPHSYSSEETVADTQAMPTSTSIETPELSKGVDLHIHDNDMPSSPIDPIGELPTLHGEGVEAVEVADDDDKPSQMLTSAEMVDEEQEVPEKTQGHHQENKTDQESELEIMRQHETMLLAMTQTATDLIYQATSEWLWKNLSPSNITDISSIYDQMLIEVQSKAPTSVDITLWRELDNKLSKECKPRYNVDMCIVQNRLQTFNLALKKRFEYFDIFTVSELQKICHQEYEAAMQNLQPDDFKIAQLVKLGCEQLAKYFMDQNNQIIQNEEYFADRLIPQGVDFYHDEMNRFLSDDPAGGVVVYAPDKLKTIHATLSSRLVEGLKNAFKFSSSGSICSGVEKRLEQFRSKLNLGFGKYSKANLAKLKGMQREITKIKDKLKSAYVEKIDVILAEYVDGFEDVPNLRKIHDGIKAELKATLEAEIKQKIRSEEPTEAYWKAIQSCMDGYWRDVLQRNGEKLKKKEEELWRQEEMRQQQERRHQEDMKRTRTASIQRLLEMKPDDGVPGPSKSTGPSTSNKEPPEGAAALIPQSQLPPLVFHLQSKEIKMGMIIDGQPHILTIDPSEEPTPFIVGVSPTGNLIYGREVLAKIPEKGKSTFAEGHQPAIKFWWLADLLMSHSDEDSIPEFFQLRGGGYLKVSPEFMLAFILKKLKEEVEAYRNGACSTAVIAIPIWYGSVQRIRVRDAGNLAGFQEVYLINEASAAANSWVNVSRPPSTMTLYTSTILILSEHSGVVDISFYGYLTSPFEINMIGHCSNYSVHEKKKSKSTLKKMVQCVSPDPNPATEGSSDDDEQRLRKIKKKCKEMLKQAKHSPVIVLAESKEWQTHLEKLGGEIEGLTLGFPSEDMALHGACDLSQDPPEIRNRIRDRLAFDVMVRRCWREGEYCAISKNYILPNGFEHVSIPSVRMDGGLGLFQKVLGREVHLGRVNGIPNMSENYYLSGSLSISNEGIVEMASVGYATPQGRTCPLGLRQYWTPNNLKPEEVAGLKFQLDSLTAKEEDKLTIAKEQLLERCRRLEEQLEAGNVFNISSDHIRAVFEDKIKYSVDLAQHSNCTVEKMQAQLEHLVLWASDHVK